MSIIIFIFPFSVLEESSSTHYRLYCARTMTILRCITFIILTFPFSVLKESSATHHRFYCARALSILRYIILIMLVFPLSVLNVYPCINLCIIFLKDITVFCIDGWVKEINNYFKTEYLEIICCNIDSIVILSELTLAGVYFYNVRYNLYCLRKIMV